MSAVVRSTVTYRSNLQPVNDTCLTDHKFLKAIRDPFALEILKKVATGYRFSAIQDEEYRNASLHCSYAARDDYPWGTIRKEDGLEYVVCKCTNTECRHFSGCRPDFQEDELLVVMESLEIARRAALIISADPDSFEGLDITAGDNIAADTLIKRNTPQAQIVELEHHREKIQIAPQIQPTAAIHDVQTQKHVQKPGKDDKGFESFIMASQKEVIEQDVTRRAIINAGPGTGKTWTLIEKLIYLVEVQGVDPESILVLCFSRAAVEVVQQRLLNAACEERVGYSWRKIEIRTFDSFATFMIAWVQEMFPDLLPNNYSLEAQDYDTRIRMARQLLQKKTDMFSQYKHIIIDEVQDLVGCRAEFVLQMLSIIPDSCGFTLLGDACQALYDWQANEDLSIITSERFYTDLFRNFADVDFFLFCNNYRQDGVLSQIAIPYREAILTGTADSRAAVAADIQAAIPPSEINLKHITRNDADGLTQNGTVGILTRTNGQALRVSTWLKNAEISHTLKRPATSSYLGGWIARVLMSYPNQTINEELFTQAFGDICPMENQGMAKDYWLSLTNTQRNQNPRYEVEDLLKGLLTNARDKLLFSSLGINGTIAVSNIHRAKGREFDTVLVLDEVLSAMSDVKKDDIQEHKVCYVAITRPRKQLNVVPLSTQYIYSKDRAGKTMRCFQTSKTPGRKPYLSHIEIGYSEDLDKNHFAHSKELQTYIQEELMPDTRLRLKKCPENCRDFITYKLVPEEHEGLILGYTGRTFASEIERAIQRIWTTRNTIRFDYYPEAFSDVYVEDFITCISVAGQHLPGAKVYGNFGIWMGFTVSGFARIERERY